MKTYTVTAHWQVIARDEEEAWIKASDEAPVDSEIDSVDHDYEEEDDYDEEREWRS